MNMGKRDTKQMYGHIKGLEKTARQLEPDKALRQLWNEGIQGYADEFLDQIEQLKAYNKSEENGKGILELPFSEEARPLDQLLPRIKEQVDRIGINPASGGHLGYIPGGGVFPTAMGDYLAAVTNRYSGIFFANPGAVRMENYLIRWMCDLISYPQTAFGNLCSGGSIANLIAITTARDFKKIKAKEVEQAVIYLTRQVHHCVQKALRIAGLGEAHIRYIQMDKSFRMDVGSLKEQVKKDITVGLKPFLVVGSAGTTDTGSIDPLDAIADIARQYDLWYHVDAAYGGFFLLVDEFKAAFKGIERSDSLAIDPHKGMFLSYGLGAILIKNVDALFHTHHYLANYMQDAQPDLEEWSPADLSPELTKHFRGMRMWLPMQLFGLKPFKSCLQEKVWLCRYFYEKIQELGFEVGPYPELSVAIYRYLPPNGDANAFNEQLVKYIHDDGRIFLSSTTINGVFWLRLAVLSFRTHLREIDLCLEILREGVRKIILGIEKDD